VNFTREPIIETVITPKDGYKLSIRNSKGGSQEEYFVDAIEVVSFGQAMFFRSQERPKSFLLPVTDYEVVEAKETRVVLKNAPLEGSIKIGGGKVYKREGEERAAAPSKPSSQEEGQQGDRPRRRKSSRRRRLEGEEGNRGGVRQPVAPSEAAAPAEKSGEGEPPLASSMFRSLFPPPPGLISEKFRQESLKDSSSAEVKESPQDKENEQEASYPQAHEETPPLREEVEDQQSPEKEEGPRYHSAPREDNEGPFFRAETNFVY